MATDQQLISTLDALWRISAPGSANLLSSQEFVSLKAILTERFKLGKPTFGFDFALQNILRSLGLPCLQLQKFDHPQFDLTAKASALALEFSRKTAKRRYMCPLDLAEDIPLISFGNSRLGRFSKQELEMFFDAPRLERHYPRLQLDSGRLSEFHWLIVEEDVVIKGSVSERAFPFLMTSFESDLGEFDPYGGRFPSAVESALFFLLLAPWEDWALYCEVDWRGFRLPWIYTVNDDLCVSPASPPDPESLSWEPNIYTNEFGETVETEEPIAFRLNESIQALTDEAWKKLQVARKSELFSTPVEHFLVRAFMDKNMDEVLAHLTVIDAAFGTESDHNRTLRNKPDYHKSQGATRRVAARLCAALQNPKTAKDYLDLFDLRSKFIHGRTGLRPISTDERIQARSLARRAANSLLNLANQKLPRETLLAQPRCTTPQLLVSI